MSDVVDRSDPALALVSILNALDRGGLGAVSRDQLRALPALYRSLVSDLAEKRARGLAPREAQRLEALVLRAHALLYAPDPPRLGRAFFGLLAEFPREVRRSLRALLLVAALFSAGAIIGYGEVQRDPTSAVALLPGALHDNAEESFQTHGSPRDGHPLYGALYFTNNARVALTAFALGASFGVGTLLVITFNGVIIGATAAVVAAEGSMRAFWSFVLPHGGIELAAIFIAAAGGLRMAEGMLFPGSAPRQAALLAAARAALPLALGAALVLAVAGLVEGWVSPLPWPIGAKAALGGALDAGLFAYLVIGGRHQTELPA